MIASDAFGMTHVFLPSENPAKTPTLVLLHGTGGDEHDLISLGQTLLPSASILSPRGKVNENGMARFFRRLAPGIFDIEDLIARTHELNTFFNDASKHYGFDLGQTIIVGYSNGANIAASLLLLHSETVKTAVLLHAMVPLEPETLPNLRETQVFLSVGEHDHMIPPEQTDALAELLKKAGAGIEMHRGPGGHEITDNEVEASKQWLRLTLSPEQAS